MTKSVAETVVESLQERVLSGDLPIGTHLKQELLAEEYQVSRMPVRQALEQLRAKGIIEIVPNRGAFVRGPSPNEIREAYLVRAELEGLAAELAASLVTDEQLRRLREAERIFQTAIENGPHRPLQSDGEPRTPDASGWIRANDMFHEVIQEAACNAQLSKTIHGLHQSFPRNLTWPALNGNLRLLRENVAQHRLIREAVEGGEALEARRLMVTHVKHAGTLIAIRVSYGRPEGSSV